ncbi:hypothetical protein PB01_08045 [Psychrobacillus glaciei]|uniref:Uncharacterized protein n=1 Tax=Psychrobacillus glaciei TaxID=2283160 RepID=A0A5J6SLL5_9BACI|nr:hypothetical protein [Psychrobacillus glaciei]QFF98786.1 hypothetical protein PB01_08045 [Psychrobacillus glaciei]
MNKSILAEEFGEQLEAVTIGTPYAVDPDSDNFISELEQRIRRVMYNLWMDAQSQRLAKHLQRKQVAHFEELYEFSYGVPMYDKEYAGIPRDTESLAIRIIDEKQAFIKRNEHLYLRYERFKEITNNLPASSKQILVDYFEYRKKIDYELLRNTLKKHLKAIERIYKADEESKEAEAENQEDERQAKLGCKAYLINRRKVYMIPEDYAAHVERDRTERLKVYEQLGLAMP